MEASHAIKFYLIADLFKEDVNQLKRGENAYSSGHVKKMLFNAETQPAFLKGEVQASMKNKVYKVEVHIHLNEGVVSTQCSCPRGQALCHHIAALLYHGHYNISSTDKAREWGVKGKAAGNKDEIETIDKLYPREPYSALVREISANKIEQFRHKLRQSNVVGFAWLLQPEANNEISVLVPPIDEILFSEAYLHAKNKEEYLLSQCEVDQQKIQQVAEFTIGQHKNEGWMIARKMRLTASKFGTILSACKRDKYSPSLFKSLLEGYDLQKVLAVQWGRDHEETALKTFMETTGKKVHPTGLWLHECGFLGASPDGLIDTDKILEIKCPYKFRNCTIREGVADKKYFFYYENDQVVVDTSHLYFHQMQGQLYITGRDICIFFVWTPFDCEYFEIEKDPEWIANLDILKKFYLEKFIPAIFEVK
ncbi:uncharacterized protein LOC116180801 [Photinus pyralis]|nr:uncharacterized protein LOC116180801 [Photinus pyralis]